jgi:hypothetical protein
MLADVATWWHKSAYRAPLTIPAARMPTAITPPKIVIFCEPPARPAGAMVAEEALLPKVGALFTERRFLVAQTLHVVGQLEPCRTQE